MQAQRANYLLEAGAIQLGNMCYWTLTACEAIRSEKATHLGKLRKGK